MCLSPSVPYKLLSLPYPIATPEPKPKLPPGDPFSPPCLQISHSTLLKASSLSTMPFGGNTTIICSFLCLHSEVFKSLSLSLYPASLQQLTWHPRPAQFLHQNTFCCLVRREAKYLRQLISYTRIQKRTGFFLLLLLIPKTSLSFFS